MAKEEVLFLLLGGMGLFLFLALGIAMACSDLGCGMFFCYKDGGIYSAKSGRRLADDPRPTAAAFPAGWVSFSSPWAAWRRLAHWQ